MPSIIISKMLIVEVINMIPALDGKSTRLDDNQQLVLLCPSSLL